MPVKGRPRAAFFISAERTVMLLQVQRSTNGRIVWRDITRLDLPFLFIFWFIDCTLSSS